MKAFLKIVQPSRDLQIKIIFEVLTDKIYAKFK